jgi:hypothetical protein
MIPQETKLTELDAGLTPYQRRVNDEHAIRCMASDELGRDSLDHPRLTVDQHAAFRQSLSKPKPVDEIDELVEELRAREIEGEGARL